MARRLLGLGMFLTLLVTFSAAQAQEFVLGLPLPVQNTQRQDVNGGVYSITTRIDGDLVAFESITIDFFQERWRFDLFIQNGSFVRASRTEHGEWNEPRQMMVGAVIEEAQLQEPQAYYSLRDQNAPGWNGNGDFLAHIRRQSDSFSQDEFQVLGRFITMADAAIDQFGQASDAGQFQPAFEILFRGFERLYLEWREVNALLADFSTDGKKPGDPLAVSSSGLSLTTWASLKGR